MGLEDISVGEVEPGVKLRRRVRLLAPREEVAHHCAHVLGDLLRRGAAEDALLARAHERAEDGAGRAGHPHAVLERDLRVREEPPEALLEILVLGLVARVVAERLERAVVSLVEEEDLAVLEDAVDEPVEEVGPAAHELRLVEAVDLVEDGAAEVVQTQVELEEDVALALEVVIERGLRDPEPLGDLPQRRLVVALLVEELERDIEDPLAREQPVGADNSDCGLQRVGRVPVGR
jgi:hypothetical protein